MLETFHERERGVGKRIFERSFLIRSLDDRNLAKDTLAGTEGAAATLVRILVLLLVAVLLFLLSLSENILQLGKCLLLLHLFGHFVQLGFSPGRSIRGSSLLVPVVGDGLVLLFLFVLGLLLGVHLLLQLGILLQQVRPRLL